MQLGYVKARLVDICWKDGLTPLPYSIRRVARGKNGLTLSTQNCSYLEDEFDGEDTSEDEVEVVEDGVADGALVDGIFSSQSNAAGADDDHDEQIKVTKVHDEVTEPSNSSYEQNDQNTFI